jgi:hypothetical protein
LKTSEQQLSLLNEELIEAKRLLDELKSAYLQQETYYLGLKIRAEQLGLLQRHAAAARVSPSEEDIRQEKIDREFLIKLPYLLDKV